MKQIFGHILRFAPLCAVLLAILELVVSNQFAGSGKVLRTADISIDAVRSENAVLEQKLASASSLLTIHAKATET